MSPLTIVTAAHLNINFSAGIGLNFMPFMAGSQFITSLDDANGNNIINTSKIFAVIIAIVGASVGGAAVLFGICLTIFLIRDHRRYRRELSRFDKSAHLMWYVFFFALP